jgi:type IV pilus assembly protein PilY1
MEMRTFAFAVMTTLLGTLYASTGSAQTKEDFTGTVTNKTWFYSGGACLTASTSAGTGTEFTSTTAGTAGIIPGCTAIQSNSDAYNGETLVGGNTGTLPDTPSSATCPANTVCGGALRFTNGCINGNCKSSGSGGGHNQFGAIISGDTFDSSTGVQVTFKTVTYRGDSQGNGGDGADGISFFLLNAFLTDATGKVTTNANPPNIGQYGGSLAYTCSNQNANYGYGGIVGGYIGLGIDEYGNFLNGSNLTNGETGGSTTNGGQGDNTASGGLYMPNRIGLRGAGNVAWSWLHATYPTYYPGTLSSSLQAAAVQNTCLTGTLWDYSNSSSPSNTTTTVLDYAAIPNAFKVLSGVTIANEYSNGGLKRSDATPILYKLKITSAGLLSLNYSYNGGAWQSVLTNQSIAGTNGSLPTTLRFGFAGSTGGSSNIHEVLCFKAAAADTSSSSATTNQTQSSRVTSSTQAYFSYYDPNDWTGRLTANSVSSDSSGNLTIASTPTWDASCVLTGYGITGLPATCPTTGATGATNAESPTSRVILSWDPALNSGAGGGIPFEPAGTAGGGISTAQQTVLNLGDATSNGNRLNYLRGVRTNEVTTAGAGLFRDRDYVLSDIVDSSPVAVGQPVLPYAATWKDKLYTSTTMPENSSTASYTQFISAQQTRQNVVYVGANDGMVHGFRAGKFDSTNTYQTATNDGTEVLAYFPGSLLQSAASSATSGSCASTVATQTVAQNIHGETPVIGTSAACFNASLDYSNTQYGHNFFVDATPVAGDLFYGASAATEKWHTWLVGGLGPGGAALYALDVTTPGNFSEANASTVVIGEWNASNISCANVTATSTTPGCGINLGNTYGTPLIRRLHNGTWAVIFGNGFGSTSGDAGVYIMTVAPDTGTKTFYYLSTGKGTGTTTSPCSSSCDGIAYVTSADLDGDHITDYLYAGDLLGNVWRFDLTSSSPSSWAVSTGPLFAAGATHPITSSLVVGVVAGVPGNQIMVAFGTGQKTPLTNTTAASYAGSQQYLYAFWDWNYSTWNTLQPSAQYASLTTGTSGTSGLSSPYTITWSASSANMTAQTLTVMSGGTVDISSQPICWQGTTACSTGDTSFGWYAALPSTQEQVIYNPLLVGSAFSVNTIIPAVNSLLSCSTSLDSGYSYAIALGTGTVAPASTGSTSFFVNTTTTTVNPTTGVTTTVTTTNTDASAAAVQTNATGTSTVMTTSTTASSTSIAGTGTGSTVSCTLGGTCNNLPSSLVTLPGPFAGVTGCSAGDTYLVYQTTSGTASYYRVAPKCPLKGSRVTRSQVR